MDGKGPGSVYRLLNLELYQQCIHLHQGRVPTSGIVYKLEVATQVFINTSGIQTIKYHSALTIF